jgi:hypothetical protein
LAIVCETGKVDVQKRITTWEKEPATYWRDTLKYAERHDIPFKELVRVIVHIAEARAKSRRYPKGCTKHVQIIINELFKARGSTSDFQDALAVKKRTGNIEEIINCIRSRLAVPGWRGNIVPGRTNVYIASIKLKTHFSAIMHPERCFSGFRIALVAYVKLVAFLLLNRQDVAGLRVDLWGDSCEIGGREVTRFVFRILSELPANLSAQSANATFTFAVYYGKSLFSILRLQYKKSSN